MIKLHRRGYLAISTIAAVAALLVAVPAGAFAAEESSGGSASAEAATEPSGESTEWAPPSAEGGETGSSDSAPPLEHGSSVGSGAVKGKAPSNSEPSSAPAPSASPEPEPSTPAAVAEPTSTPRAGSGTHRVQPAEPAPPPPPPAKKASKPVDVEVGTAVAVEHPASPQADDTGSAPPPAAIPAASFAESGDRASGSSYALPLLGIVVLGLVLGFAGVRLRRYRQRMRREVQWREQDEAWEEALRRAKLKQMSATAAEPSPQPLQRVNVG